MRQDLDKANTIESLRAALTSLCGRWRGTGQGDFPTIEAFSYGEDLIITPRQGTNYLTYEQQTTLRRDDGTPGEPGHWESGVIHPGEDGLITWTSAHDSLRVEVLHGHLDQSDPGLGLTIDLESIHYGNDPRMISSTRRITVSGNELRYEVRMATQNTPEMTDHLQAALHRVG